jgi:hypothetical protein
MVAKACCSSCCKAGPSCTAHNHIK